MRVSVVLLFACGIGVAAAQEPNARVTSASREYCASLQVRYAALPTARHEPQRTLAEDGTRLCEVGHVRSGVAKLRRALRIAAAGSEAPTAGLPLATAF